VTDTEPNGALDPEAAGAVEPDATGSSEPEAKPVTEPHSEGAAGPDGEGASLQRATLGGGCFWCLEAAFQRLRGVRQVVSGYAGGHVTDPTYAQVCRGDTGHAEVVQVTFDPVEVSFEQLLEVFFALHDPTTPNRQGADVGPQYRSIILYEDAGQRDAARRVMEQMAAAGTWRAPIITEVAPLGGFYPAEGHHQDYYRRNSGQAYCRAVIDPKLAKLTKDFGSRLRDARA